MQISIYFSYSFVNENSPIHKVTGQGASAMADPGSETTAKALCDDGWTLAHAIKTAQSAQLDSFNFLLIFEKK
jgi:hypothetical protein|tara:strand:+ start:320 stop:538 length:219 start_codon:yes stop_codon:yes gene_type:complete